MEIPIENWKRDGLLGPATLLDDMADEFERTARLRRWLWGNDDVRASVWQDAASKIRMKINHLSMSSNEKS